MTVVMKMPERSLYKVCRYIREFWGSGLRIPLSDNRMKYGLT